MLFSNKTLPKAARSITKSAGAIYIFTVLQESREKGFKTGAKNKSPAEISAGLL
jgi:hypothetical protein